MLSLSSLILTLGAAGALAAPAPGQAPAPHWPQPDPLQGMWRNPTGSVTIRIDACGPKLCGWVATASAEAIDDAKAGGTDHLIGTRLFENYARDAANNWTGEAFVPDIGKRFASHIMLIDHNHARVAGCLLGVFLCQSQVWTRL
ncbi:DUF2147 domain-containing protein [Novosphingobium sp.]|uniref:DUF2147 domain-containing protein n=1 Tax=Novosphingobium sp. TaxID=1874826 RepID=UPI003B523D2A